MLHQLQSNQLSVRHFCSTLVTFTAPLLLAYLDRDFPLSTNERGVPSTVLTPARCMARHVQLCLEVLGAAVELMECETRAGSSSPAQHHNKLRVSRVQSIKFKVQSIKCNIHTSH